MVIANCLYSWPVMPPKNPTGTKTAQRTSTIAITGPVTSSMAFFAASLGDRSVFDVTLDVLNHDDGVVHHDADRQNHAEQRQRINGEPQRLHPGKCADQRDGHCHGRDQRGTPRLEKKIHDEKDQDHRISQGLDDFVDRNLDESRRVVGDVVRHAGRKSLGLSSISARIRFIVSRALARAPGRSTSSALGFPLIPPFEIVRLARPVRPWPHLSAESSTRSAAPGRSFLQNLSLPSSVHS